MQWHIFSRILASEEQTSQQLLDDLVKKQMENEGATTHACHIKEYSMMHLALKRMMDKCTF
jgi:hypothetical protein